MLNTTDKEIEQMLHLRGNILSTDTDNQTQKNKRLHDDRDNQTNQQLLAKAARCFANLADFRKRRNRSIDYYRGRQWNDTIVVNGNTMTEEQYIEMQGRPALKQNLIRTPLRNLIGQYRNNPGKPLIFARNREEQSAAEMMTLALESVLDMNDSQNRDARQLEEFLISGCAIYRTSFSMDNERQRAIPKFRAVNPNRFFVNTDAEDCQGDDVDFVGEIMDMSMEQLVATYAHCPQDEEWLRKTYGEKETNNALAKDILQNMDMGSQNSHKCRVVEVWHNTSNWRLYCHDYLDGTYFFVDTDQKRLVDQENERRARYAEDCGMPVPKIVCQTRYANEWECRHLTPYGQTLFCSPSPYAHGSHPYVFSFYPMLNGECWGMVEDLIDQQRMVNRNMILFDFINSASAKGVLLVPEDCIPEDYTIEDIAEEWAKYDGVIKIRTRPGAQIPQQITSNAMHGGMMEMIRMQMGLMNDIGGVHDAVQGKNTNSGTPSSLYAQQSQNSMVNTLDYIESFNQIIKKRDQRLIQLIRQYYTSRQLINLAGKDYHQTVHNFDPEKVKDIDFDNTIIQNTDTPAFRTLVDNTLMQLLQQKAIDTETFLKNCTLPFADKMLQEIDKQKKGYETASCE